MPNNIPGKEYSATINAGTATTDIAVTLAELTLNGGQIQLNQPLHVGTMTINGGSILGNAGVNIDGDLVLRTGLISNTEGPTGFDVAGRVIKRGYGRATLAPFDIDGDYEIVIEQGKFAYGNGGLGSTAGAVAIATPEFARIETSNPNGLTDDVHLNNARGFSGTGALVSNQSRSTISGDIFLGDLGAVIGLVPGGITDGVMTVFGGVHGGSLKVAGHGTVNIESDSSTYTGPTVLGADGEYALLRLRGPGRLLSTHGFDIGGHATLIWSNETQYVEDRIPDSVSIVMRGGTIESAHVAAGFPRTERMGALHLAQGTSEVRGDSTSSSLTFQRVEREYLATVRFNLASSAGDSEAGQLFFFVEAPMTANGILGSWATMNADFATYDPLLGVVPLSNRVSRPSQINVAAPSDHVRVTLDSLAALTADRTIATLAITNDGDYDVDLGGHTLTLRDGGFLRSAFTSVHSLVSNGKLTAGDGSGPAELHLRSQWTFANTTANPLVRISADIVDNPLGGELTLVNSGNVKVFLSGTNSYSGPTVIQDSALEFQAESALPDGNELIVVGGTASLQYQPTGAKRLTRLSLQQGGYISSPKLASTQQSAVEIDADEYLLESGAIGISLAGDGVLRKVGDGVAELTYESPNFTGPVIVEQGVLVAGSRSVVAVPRALGFGETTIMPGGTLVHSAVLAGAGYMRLDANLNLAGGDVGIGPSIRTSRWDFNGAWRVTADSRLLLFDPRGIDEITTPQGNLTTPTVNLLQDVSGSDGVSLTVLGEGLVKFAGGLSLAGNASIVAENASVNVSAISASTDGATLSLRGKGIFQIPRTLSTTGPQFTIEIAADAQATPATGGAFSIANGVTLEVNGRLSNSNSQPLTMFGGKVAGVGALGNVLNNGGELSPGNSVGVLTVGDYQQGVGGALTVELLGGPEVTSDQLRARVASLNGTVHALLAAGADVLPGDVFDVVVADQILATDLTLQPQGFAGRLDVVTLSTGPDAGKQVLRLLVAPEPATSVISICTVILLWGFNTRSLASRAVGRIGPSAMSVSPFRTQSLSFPGR